MTSLTIVLNGFKYVSSSKENDLVNTVNNNNLQKTTNEIAQKSLKRNGSEDGFSANCKKIKLSTPNEIVYPSGRVYKGQIVNGKPHGEGIEFYANGNRRYKGQWKNGKFHGQGKAYHPNGVLSYEGQFQNGKPEGFGRAFRSDGTLHYEGQFVNGQQHGYGKWFYPDGTLRYEGYWKNGRPSSSNTNSNFLQ